MGGTEIHTALYNVVQSLSPDSMADIILLTDGEYHAMDSVVRYVQDTFQQSRGRIRFFTLGIGKEVSHALVDNIAQHGGGCSSVVAHTRELNMKRCLVNILEASMTRHVGTVAVELDGRQLTTTDGLSCPYRRPGPTLLSCPANLNRIGGFDNHRIFLLFDSASHGHPGWVTIRVLAPGGADTVDPIVLRVMALDNSTGANLLHKMAARALLGGL